MDIYDDNRGNEAYASNSEGDIASASLGGHHIHINANIVMTLNGQHFQLVDLKWAERPVGDGSIINELPRLTAKFVADNLLGIIRKQFNLYETFYFLVNAIKVGSMSMGGFDELLEGYGGVTSEDVERIDSARNDSDIHLNPAVYSAARDHSELFLRGADGNLRYYYHTGGQWNIDSTSLTASKVTGPIAAVYSNARKHSEVFFRGENRQLQTYYVKMGDGSMTRRLLRQAMSQAKLRLFIQLKETTLNFSCKAKMDIYATTIMQMAGVLTRQASLQVK